jgi:hypothetical protein
MFHEQLSSQETKIADLLRRVAALEAALADLLNPPKAEKSENPKKEK